MVTPNQNIFFVKDFKAKVQNENWSPRFRLSQGPAFGKDVSDICYFTNWYSYYLDGWGSYYDVAAIGEQRAERNFWERGGIRKKTFLGLGRRSFTGVSFLPDFLAYNIQFIARGASYSLHELLESGQFSAGSADVDPQVKLGYFLA